MLPKDMKSDSVSAYVHMRRNIPPPIRSCTHFGRPPSLHKLRTYLIDISFLNQKTHEDIRISIH